jgi:hypothetical protein
MAVTEPTNRALHDGARNVVYEMTWLSTGTDEPMTVKVDVSELKPPCKAVKITRIEYNVAGGLVRLWWDADDPAVIADLTGVGHFDYKHIGGMVSPLGAAATGDIKLSTLGFDSGSSYTIKLSMKKKF